MNPSTLLLTLSLLPPSPVHGEPATARAVQPAPPTAVPVVRPQPAPARDASRQLRIAGVVTLNIGAVLLGLMAGGIANQRYDAKASQRLADQYPGPTLTIAEYNSIARHLDSARLYQRLAIGAGISSAVMSILGVTLLVAGTRKTTKSSRRPHSVSLAPWWLSSGAGVSLHMPLP